MRRVLWLTPLIIGACAGAGEGPGDVAGQFWQAAQEGDAQQIALLSIPSDNASIDPTRSQSIEEVTLGEELIEDDRATVPTTVAGMSEQMPTVDFHTVLVQTDQGWRVDLDQTTDEMFKAIMGVSMGAMVEGMGEALAEGMGQAMEGLAEGMAEGMKDMAEAMGDAMSDAAAALDTSETQPLPRPEPMARQAAPPGPGELPWTPARVGTVRPGMTIDEVTDAWGQPALVRHVDRWSYLFYRNGCERRCGTHDVLFLESGQVVDAVVRTTAHQYSGVSSSPPGQIAAYTPPHRGA